MAQWRLMSRVVLCLIMGSMGVGCAPSPFPDLQCSASAPATIDTGPGLEVPDQSIAGCATVEVRRVFANEFERGLIAASEHLPSTAAGAWEPFYGDVDTSEGVVGSELLVPVAVTTDAIWYYTERSRQFATPFFTEESISYISRRAYFKYTADVTRTTADSSGLGNVYEVRLVLDYSEFAGGDALWLLVGVAPPGVGVHAERTVRFDGIGNMIDVAGDGVAERSVLN